MDATRRTRVGESRRRNATQRGRERAGGRWRIMSGVYGRPPGRLGVGKGNRTAGGRGGGSLGDGCDQFV